MIIKKTSETGKHTQIMPSSPITQCVDLPSRPITQCVDFTRSRRISGLPVPSDVYLAETRRLSNYHKNPSSNDKWPCTKYDRQPLLLTTRSSC